MNAWRSKVKEEDWARQVIQLKPNGSLEATAINSFKQLKNKWINLCTSLHAFVCSHVSRAEAENWLLTSRLFIIIAKLSFTFEPSGTYVLLRYLCMGVQPKSSKQITQIRWKPCASVCCAFDIGVCAALRCPPLLIGVRVINLFAQAVGIT